MKLYKIYVKKSGKKIDDVILINDGFELKAFLLTFIYTLYFKLWKQSILLILLTVLGFLFIKSNFSFIWSLGIMLFTGFGFSDWYENKVKKDKKHVEFWGRTIGRNKNEARMNFFDEINKK